MIFYNPNKFKCIDLDKNLNFIKENSFATLVTYTNNDFAIAYAPLLPKIVNEKLTLFGHLASANQFLKNFDGETKILTIFNGAHKYISPKFYSNPMNVPTWNYTSVIASGPGKLIVEHLQKENLLRELVTNYEGKSDKAWKMDLPEEFKNSLINTIECFSIEVVDIEGKFKLSQNRKPEDMNSLIDHLQQSQNADDQKMLNLIKKESS